MQEKLHVGLIYGGRSPEHEVSINSARNVFDALTDAERYRVTPLRIDRDGRWHAEDLDTAALRHPDAASNGSVNTSDDRALFSPAEDGAEVLSAGLEPLDLDVAFPMLHGPNGEDGRVQGLLETLGLPYVGVGTLGSAACMDKDVAKRLMRDADLPIVPFRTLRFGEEKPPFPEVRDVLGLPVFVKPANAGSSVGASKVESEDEYAPAVEDAFDFDNKVLIETAIDGREIECAVMGNLGEPRATAPGEIVSEAEFYTYDAKYDEELDAARMEVPAELPEDLRARIRSLATDAFRLLNCEGFARVDFFVPEGNAAEEHDLFLNEINTIPGFTARSMFPVMWEHMGAPLPDLLEQLIQLALDRHERDRRLKMTL